MACNRWCFLVGMAFMLSAPELFAGEIWLAIVSDSPGAAVAVDGTYRGVTPQRLGDILHIQVSNGTHEISASVRVDGKDYVSRQVIKAREDRENLVRINLHQEITRASALPMVVPAQASKSPLEMQLPLDDLKVPGRNF